VNLALLGLPQFLNGAGAIGFAAIMIIIALSCFIATFPKDLSIRKATVQIGRAFLLVGIAGPLIFGDAVVIVAFVVMAFVAIRQS